MAARTPPPEGDRRAERADRPSDRHAKATRPPSGHHAKATRPPSDRHAKATRPPSGRPADAARPLSGRRAEAARNDERILESARAVFLADPGAPITAVAKHAGVGISALYTRYASKEDLLRKLCNDGLQLFVDETEAAIADERDDWTAFAGYMARLVDADTSSMTLALAGSFTPTKEMFELAERANELLNRFFDRVKGALRPDLDVHDLSLIFELVAAIKLEDRERTLQLRHRYLTLILDGIRAKDGQALPGPPPSWRELNERWMTP